eukprot:COSAG02_NODE_724_length_18036_cov_162.971511_1_plen_3396_part_00
MEPGPRPFVLRVPPLKEPPAEEKAAWESYLQAVNAKGWGGVQAGLSHAREGAATWEAVLETIGTVERAIEGERAPLTEAIGSAQAENLVSQLALRVLLAKAECLEQLGRWEDCLECYSTIEGDGEDAELYFKRGCCYYYTGNAGAADSNFELAVVKDPAIQSQIDAVKIEPCLQRGGGSAPPQNPGEIGAEMIGPMRPGESRPVYDAAFDASALHEDTHLEQALQASLKEDHFSAGGASDTSPPSSKSAWFDLPASADELEASLTDCLSEASQLPQCGRQPWSAMVPEEREALALLGWTEQTWETAAYKAPWKTLTEDERTAALQLGFNAASWVWMKFREWLPQLVAHVILRKRQPTWEESMIKLNLEGVAAAEEYESVHRRLIDSSIRVLVEALGRRYQWATGCLCQLLDNKQEGLYTCQKWSKATGKLEEHGAPQLHMGAVSAFIGSHGVARIAEVFERTTQLDDGLLPILELLVMVHANVNGADVPDDLSKDTARVVTVCVDKLAAQVSEDHSGTLLLLQQLLKLKLGRDAGVQLWKDLCMRDLGSDKYLARVNALEQLVKLADSTDAGLTALEFTDWVESSNVYHQVFGEKMPLDKPEYKQRAKEFFLHAKLAHSEATFVHWMNLLLPKLSASVVQDLVMEVCLDSSTPVELWIQLVKRLVAIVKGQRTGYDGDEECQQSVLGFVPVLFSNVELVARRHEAVCDCTELLKAAMDALARLPVQTEEANRTQLLLLNAYTDMWNVVDDSDQFLESNVPPVDPPDQEERLSAEESIAKLAELEQKQKDGKFVSTSTLKRLRKQVDEEANVNSGHKKVSFAGETFDAQDATMERVNGIENLPHSQDASTQHVADRSDPAVPELNLRVVDGSKQSDGLTLSEEQVLEECMQILAGNESGASRGQVTRLIQEIRQKGEVVSTESVVTKMFDTPMEPDESASSASVDSMRAERLRQEREAAAQSEPSQFREDLSDTNAFPSLSDTGLDTGDSQTIEESTDDHEKWSVFVCSGPNGEDWFSEARKAHKLATETDAATDTRQTCTQASRALKAIVERLALLEENIGAESAGDVVHTVRTELLEMRAHSFFGIGSWKRCIEDCDKYLEMVANTEIEELRRAAARRSFDDGEDEDEPSGTSDDSRTKRKRSAQNFAKDMQEDPEVVQQLMQMGFSLNSCKKASRASRDLESAATWLVQHSQDDDIDDDPGELDEVDKENEVRVDLDSHASAQADTGIIRSDGTVLECLVSYEDTADWVGMAACGHKFSTVAWQDWIRTHQAKPTRLVCMGHACNEPIPTHFVLEMVEPGDREMVKKAIVDRGSTSSGSSVAAVAAPPRLFHESLRDLRVRYARQCVADINEQLQGEAGCMPECRPIALDFLMATIQSFSATQVDVERRGSFIEDLNAENDRGTTLVELLLVEIVAFAKSCGGDVQRQGVSSRLELLTLLHRFCKPLLLSWEMTSRLWDNLEALECRTLLFSWVRTSLTHSPDIEPAHGGAFACFTADVRQHVLSRLVELSASQLDVQAYHLFQNVMISINADAGKLQIGGWCKTATNINVGDYCASSAIPAGNESVELVDVSGSNSIVGISASGVTKELHGSRTIPKGQDGEKLVGTWVKVLQHGQVWKDGQLTRFYSKAGSSLYDIRYVDGCVQRRNLQSLKSWMVVDPLETQMPIVINVTAVTDGDLLGLDVLWRAAVQSPNEEVSVLARSLLFRLYTQMGDTLCSEETIQLALDTADAMLAETIRESMGVSHGLACKALVLNNNEWEATFQWLQDKQIAGSLDIEAMTPLTLEQAQLATDALPADLRARLIEQVETGLRQSITMIEAGNIASAEHIVRRQIDIVQSFVNRYQSNGKTRQHLVSRRGSPLTVKVLGVSIDVHANMTCSELHSKVCGQLQVAANTPLEYVKHDKTAAPLACTSVSTLGLEGVQNDFEIRERRDKISDQSAAEVSVVADHFCPGELLAQSSAWFELLFGLLGLNVSAATRSAIWQLLMSIPTMACEKKEVLDFRISWTPLSSVLRTVYDLQIVEAIIDPPSEDVDSIADDWCRAFVSNGDHFAMFIAFMTKIETHGGDLDDPTACAQCLPVIMRVLHFCIRSALPNSANDPRGLSRSFSSSSATAVFGTLENSFGSNYLSALVQHVCYLMNKAVASRQVQAMIFGAKVLLAVAGQTEATCAVLRVGVPLLITLLVTCPEHAVRTEAVDVLHSIALISEEAGMSIMQQVRSTPLSEDCAELCDEYFDLLRQLQRSLPSTRQNLAARLVADLQETCSAGMEHQQDNEKSIACRIDLLRDICEQDGTVRDTVATAKLIQLLWSRCLMATASEDADLVPICRTTVGRQAVCALLIHVVCTPLDSIPLSDSPPLEALVKLVWDFVSSTKAPMQRDGESPEFDYDPEQRTGYGDSTTTKLRNLTDLAGLTNQGNTCYMNSVLQQLYGSREVRRAVLDAPLGLRVRVENRSESMQSGVEVVLQADDMEPLCLTGDHGLAFNGITELTSTLPEGRYTMRVSCASKVTSQEHVLGTGLHSIVLSDRDGNVEQQIRSQPIVTELHRCFWFLEYGAAACVDTSSLCNSLHACCSPSGASYLEYPIRSQNDAAEFLGKIVDTLGEDMKGSKAAASLKDLLTSTKVVEKQCLECKTVSHSAEDHAVLLSVTIETPELEKLGSLEQALESAAKPEILSGTNAVDCDKCGKKCPTSRSSLAKKLPRVLLVHLTRFVQNMYGEYHKANHRVTFPQRLDMRPYTTTSADRDVSEPPAWYELTGVVLHSGTQRAGHYTSLVKHNGQWITFDDQHASLFEGDLEDVCFGGEEQVTQSWGTNRTSKREKSKNAYILMYQREEWKPDGGTCCSGYNDSGGGPGVQIQISQGLESAAEGETPDPATWAARRTLRDASQKQKQTLQRQQRLFNSEVLELIRSLCSFGLGKPDPPEPDSDANMEPEPELDSDAEQEFKTANQVEQASMERTEAAVEDSEPTELESRLLHLATVTFVHTVCRYKDHAGIGEWSTLLGHWLSQPKYLNIARWLILRVGSEDGWEEANALIVPVVPKSYSARNGFCAVLRAAVDAVRRQRGEQEDAVEATVVEPVSDQTGDETSQLSDAEVEPVASTAPGSPSESKTDSEEQVGPVGTSEDDADSAGELSADDRALNNALAAVRKHLAKHDASVNARTGAAGGAGRRNAVGPDAICPPVPPLLLMDRTVDADPLAPISVKIENHDSKPMRLSGQPSPDRDWSYLHTIAPGSQFAFEKNQMSTFKGLVAGVGEYTWKRKLSEEGPVVFNKRNYTGEISLGFGLCFRSSLARLPVYILCFLPDSKLRCCLTSGFSPDNKGAGGETTAHPPMTLDAAAAATTDAGGGLDSMPSTAGSSHKTDPTPEEETIISQAIEMLFCDRQAVVRSSGHL